MRGITGIDVGGETSEAAEAQTGTRRRAYRPAARRLTAERTTIRRACVAQCEALAAAEAGVELNAPPRMRVERYIGCHTQLGAGRADAELRSFTPTRKAKPRHVKSKSRVEGYDALHGVVGRHISVVEIGCVVVEEVGAETETEEALLLICATCVRRSRSCFSVGQGLAVARRRFRRAAGICPTTGVRRRPASLRAMAAERSTLSTERSKAPIRGVGALG